MARHLETGRRGEALAAAFLKKKGFQILETNWRFSKAEIDIIAKDGGVLVFVEVKTRSSDYFGRPEDFITTHQEQLIADAASVYMKKIKHDWEIRFDIISILLKSKNDYSIEHFEDAFFPGL